MIRSPEFAMVIPWSDRAVHEVRICSVYRGRDRALASARSEQEINVRRRTHLLARQSRVRASTSGSRVKLEAALADR